MGYEFQASIPAGGAISLAELSERLCRTQRYEAAALSLDELTLRFAEWPRQPHWPEDILLKINEGGLYVLLHLGNQRVSFLDDLREVYAPAYRIEIEEL